MIHDLTFVKKNTKNTLLKKSLSSTYTTKKQFVQKLLITLIP